MSKETVYLAVDLGAGSGRVMAGLHMGDRLELEEIHRFTTTSGRLNGGYYWDALQIFGEVREGLRKAYKQFGTRIRSVGVDTWGVDYAMIDAQGHLVGLPYQYRDPRTNGMGELIGSIMPKQEVYETTGIVFAFYNSLFQLVAEAHSNHPRLRIADRLLFIPDLINYFLTGVAKVESTIASTSQMIDVRTGDWARPMLERLGIPTAMLGDIIRPGTPIGDLLPEVREEVGGNIPVVAVGSHDTASAVMAVPAAVNDYIYLSSGTWSLMGVDTPTPITTPDALAAGFTNEGGVDGGIRFLKNISGMWLLQESRRVWVESGRSYDFAELVNLAADAEPFRSLINPDHPEFSAPGDMPGRIIDYCRRTGQPIPDTPGRLVRTILESLALRYRHTFNELERLLGKSYARLHIVGGGARNALLNQFTADALARPVHAGPYEATSVGNMLVQMLASGDVATLQEGRALIASSFGMATFTPQHTAPWDAAYQRFLTIDPPV